MSNSNERDLALWQLFSLGARRLNGVIHAELVNEEPRSEAVLSALAELISSVVASELAISVRRPNPAGTELRLTDVIGRAWRERDLEQSFDLSSDPPSSIGAYVYRSGKPLVASGTYEGMAGADLFPVAFDPVVAGVRQEVVVPIFDGTEVAGVLDVRNLGPASFPAVVQSMVELASSSVGLFYSARDAMRRARESAEQVRQESLERARDAESQAMILADLRHQLVGPLLTATRISEILLKNPGRLASSIEGEVRVIRSITRRASSVALSARIMAGLIQDSDLVTARIESSNCTDLEYILNTSIEDYLILIDPSRGLDIVRRYGQTFAADRVILIDKEFASQAISALLDNAVKYSFDNTVIEVRVELDKDRLRIAVTSEGVPISRAEVAFVRARGWRGEVAEQVATEGSGLGLYIADSVMEMQGGRLDVRPTNRAHRTEVAVEFVATPTPKDAGT